MNECNLCRGKTEDLFECSSCSVLFCNDCGNNISLICGQCNEFLDQSRMDSIEED